MKAVNLSVLTVEIQAALISKTKKKIGLFWLVPLADKLAK